MTFVETVGEEAASGELASLYDAERERVGYLPNYARAFSARPEVYRAWQQLNGAIKASMDLRSYELATLAAARSLRSSYCALAHGSVLASQFYEPARVRDIAVDHHDAGLDEVDMAVMDLAEKVVDDATSVTDDDIGRLRALGLSDGEIVSVVLAAAARCFFSKTLDALGAEPDSAYAELEPELRETLTVGRPISSTP
jgi:uncharacterized peroxidase-related enzyme